MWPVNRRDQAGFGLLESLIAMLIVSIAAMGLLALVTKSMQQSTLSYERSIAVSQASSLMEQLWAGICTLPEQGFVTIESQWREQMQLSANNPLLPPYWKVASLKHSLTDDALFYRVEIAMSWRGNEQSPDQHLTQVALLPRVKCS